MAHATIWRLSRTFMDSVPGRPAHSLETGKCTQLELASPTRAVANLMVHKAAEDLQSAGKATSFQLE